MATRARQSRAGKPVDPRLRHHVAGVGAFSSFNSSRRSGRAPLTFFTEIVAHPSALMVNRRRFEIKDSKSTFWQSARCGVT
jgi:hypothetical protein